MEGLIVVIPMCKELSKSFSDVMSRKGLNVVIPMSVESTKSSLDVSRKGLNVVISMSVVRRVVENASNVEEEILAVVKSEIVYLKRC